MGRDDQTDSSRLGPGPSRESMMADCDSGPTSLADEKLMYPDSVGTASDYADVTGAVHRGNVRTRRMADG